MTSTHNTKFPGIKIFQSNTLKFDTNIINLVNVPALNNLNSSLISRNSVTGDLEIVDKSTISTNNLTLQNLGGNAIVVPGNIVLPGPAQFKGLTAGTGISIASGVNTITITNTNPTPVPSTNIYNADGAILADRTVSMNNNDLTFTSGVSSNFIISSINTVSMSTIQTLTVNTISGISLAALGGINLSGGSGDAYLDSNSDVRIGETGAANVFIGNIPSGTNQIYLYGGTLRMMNIPSNKTNYVLNINPIGASRVISYSEMVAYYGSVKYVNQTSQLITTASPVVVTGITGIALAGSGIGLSVSNGLLYTGSSVGQTFEITFTGTILPLSGGTQEITITLFSNGAELPNARNTITIGSTSGNVSITTQTIFAGISSSGNGIELGFARNTTNTSILFSGTIAVRNIVPY